MSQHDYSIANASGSAVRTDINNALGAIQTTNIGSSAPSSVAAGQLWIDNSATPWVLKVYDGADHISIGTINASTNAFAVDGLGTTDDVQFAGFTSTGIDDNASETAITIDVNEIVTIPKQPAFLGAATATQDNITGNSISSAIAFAEVFDNNADYDGTTFTAPVAGRYQFNVNVRFGGVTTAATNISIDLVTSNRDYSSMSRIDGNTGNNAGQSGSWCCDMDASDTAVVKVFGEGEGSNVWDLNIGAAKLCTFSGFLVG